MDTLNYRLPDENSKDGSSEEIKEAQAITGALPWLASKTRLDIAVAVAAMSRWTKKGTEVVNLGKDVLKYVKGTTERGLSYGPVEGWASRKGLGMKRQTNMVEVFADTLREAKIRACRASWALLKELRLAGSRCASLLWPRARRRELIGYCEALTVGRALVSPRWSRARRWSTSGCMGITWRRSVWPQMELETGDPTPQDLGIGIEGGVGGR